MPIIALSADTVRLLGSPTVITTPVDLIKELLENSIDARATSVDILVSQNIIDRIDVRDNGDGIHSDDYDSLGRAGHTSKITSFEDIHNLGGNTFGFRGQALASANNLGSILVTTKSSDDPTAVVLKLCPGVGGVESQQRTSAPVGTTVTVTGLFGGLPVRKDLALKETQKYFVRIKRLLHSYMLARPQIRVSFKTLGGNSRHSWSYSPRPEATIKEAVVQAFGTELMSQCLTRTVYSDSDTEERAVQCYGKLTIETVLPRAGANESKISKGSFFAVDHRPMSSRRGTMQKLLASFKTHFSKSLGLSDGQKTVRDPFICVNIRCSPGTYDPNIEPTKNEVLFADETHVTDLFERLCSEVYKSQPLDPFVSIGKQHTLHRTQTCTPPPSSDGPSGIETIPPAHISHDQVLQRVPMPLLNSSSPRCGRPEGPSLSPNAIDNLESRSEHPEGHLRFDKTTAAMSTGQETLGNQLPAKTVGIQLHHVSTPSSPAYPQRTEPALAPQRRSVPYHAGNKGWVVDMSAEPDMSSDDEAELLASRFRTQRETESQEDREETNLNEGLDPWSIAKMTAPARHPVDGHQFSAGSPRSVGRLQEPLAFPFANEAFDEQLPLSRHRGGSPDGLDPLRSARLSMAGVHRQTQQLSGFGHPISFGPSLDSNSVAHDTTHSHPQLTSFGGSHQLANLRSCHNKAVGDIEHNGLIQTRLAFEGPKVLQKERSNQMHLHIDDVPLRSNPPFRKPKRKIAGSKALPTLMHSNKVISYRADGLDNHHLTGNEVGQIRQHSPRQASHSSVDASSKTNTILPRQSSPSPSSLSMGNGNWFDGDLRKYLMRRQLSEAEHRRSGRQTLKRTKTDRLPLEKTPDEYGIQHLVLTVVPDTERLVSASSYTTGYDTFFGDCRSELSLTEEMSLDDVTEVETRLRSILSVWTEKILGEKTEVQLDIRSQVKGKATAASPRNSR